MESGALLAAVSVDLDEIGCYSAIHGLEPPSRDAARAIYRRALPRLRRLFDEEDLRGTFFAIGSDVDEENAPRLRALVDEGHEVANHTFSHHYDFTRRDLVEIEEEIKRGMDVIEEATGVRPVGFRAPGYTITDPVFEVLRKLRVRYDASVFPCPAYYFAKVAAIQAIRAGGRRSHSIVDDPRVLGAPADPYRVGQPYWKPGKGIIELPIGVSRGPRLPYIGTSVVLAGALGARLLTRTIVGRPLVCLELHGMDLADADEDGLRWLAPHQPDLRKSAAAKEAALRAALRTLRAAGYRFVTMREAADAFADS